MVLGQVLVEINRFEIISVHIYCKNRRFHREEQTSQAQYWTLFDPIKKKLLLNIEVLWVLFQINRTLSLCIRWMFLYKRSFRVSSHDRGKWLTFWFSCKPLNA